jgi:hypothetical protein
VAWFRTEESRVADELEALYAEYRRLERQLGEHAERAPYPHVAQRLKALLATEGENAASVAARLAELGRYAETNLSAVLRDGASSWERLLGTLEDYRSLIRQLGQLKARWDDERPEDAVLISGLRDQATRNRSEISDLIARADPHAAN